MDLVSKRPTGTRGESSEEQHQVTCLCLNTIEMDRTRSSSAEHNETECEEVDQNAEVTIISFF